MVDERLSRDSHGDYASRHPYDSAMSGGSGAGLPSEGFRTLIWHARHDPEHSGELCRVIDDMPLTEEQVSLIGVNVAHTNNLLARSVHEMIDAFEERTGRAA